MATKKKTTSTKRQSVSAARPRSYSALYKDDKTRSASAVVTTSRSIVAPKEMVAPTEAVNWREEYGYVVHDLRMLGIVSAALFGIIIITGFFV